MGIIFMEFIKMKKVNERTWVFFFLLLFSISYHPEVYSQGTGGNIVTYAGGIGNEKFQGILQLSDGSVLVGGQADNFDWLPSGVTVNTISNVSRYFSSSNEGKGFVMHLSADQQTILSVIRFPDNSVRDVYKIKTNSLPGLPTGDIFISGSRDTAAGNDGYYISRLNNNFIGGIPTGVSYYKSVDARTRNGGGPAIHFPSGNESAQKQYQLWDVNAKGQILYATGADFSFDRTGISFMNRNGIDTLMDYFSIHNPNFTGVPASSFVNTSGNPAFDLKSSSLWFKYTGTGAPGAMRSFSQGLFNSISSDENGNPGRKGAYPFDAFFSTQQNLGGAPIVTTGPGYTGYSINSGGGRWTGKIGGITFDKRTGHFYLGMSISVGSVSNQTNIDDTEPAIAAFTSIGEIKWWARLHKEDASRSSAQQQVEGIDFDYANNQLVVLGRTRGNSVNNFWKGSELKEKVGGSGFQNQLTGSISTSNATDIFWMGKYDINSGKIKHSTYIGELDASQNFSAASSNSNYDGFPNLNSGNFNLNTTIVNQLSVHPVTGQVYICGTGQRTITTLQAYQKMLKPKPYQQGGGIAATNAFVRVYNSGLDTVVYSSLLTGLWNPVNGSSDNTVLRSIFPIDSGLFVTGFHKGQGNDLVLANKPSWGASSIESTTALFGKLRFNPASPPNQPDTIVRPVDLCAGTDFTFSIPPVPGATSYLWVVEAAGWSGSSVSSSISLARTSNAFAGFLTVYAINSTGVSLARTTLLPANATVNSPTGYTFPASQCANQSLLYQVNSVSGALSYSWSIIGTGCEAWSISTPVTGNNSVIVSTGSTVVSPCSLQVIVNGCANSSTPVLFPLPTQGLVPLAPAFSTTEPTICGGISKTYSVVPDGSASGYQWTVSGTGFSGSSSSPSITINAIPGATGGQLSVVAINSCGTSNPTTLAIGDASVLTIPSVPISISGPSSGFCSDDTLDYSTPNITGASFSWYTTGNTWQVLDLSGNTARLFIPQIGGSTQSFLFVQAQNVCGLSNPYGILIRKGIPDIPGSERILPALDSGVCQGSTTTFSINPTFTATSYEWTVPAGWVINGSSNQNTVSVTATAGAQPGFFKVKAFNSCGYDSLQRDAPAIKTNTATFSVEPSPGGVINLCSGSSRLVYIVGSFTGPVKSFQWLTPSGVFVLNASSTDPSSDTVRISSTFEANSGPITVIMAGSECGVATVNLSITPNPPPTGVNGTAQLCVNPLNQIYTVNSVPGATSYLFEIQPASAGTLSVNDTTVIIDWSDTFTGNATIRAKAVSGCGPSPFSPALEIFLGLPNANVQTPPGICAAGTVVIVATGGSQFNWYTAVTGGTLIETNSGTFSPFVSSDTTFYVSITNGTCESTVRTLVNISFFSVPVAPITFGDTICSAGIVDLLASGGQFGTTYNWYSASTGGSPVFSGSSYSPSISSSTSYYVSSVSGSCESPLRTEVRAEILNNVTSPTTIADTICSPGQVNLTASGGGGSGVIYNWYADETGGIPVFTGSIYQTTINASTTFYVSSSKDGCESPRSAVIALLNGNIGVPVSQDVFLCSSGPITLVATGATSGQEYQWYDSISGGSLVFTGSSFVITNLLATDTFYVSLTDGSCQGGRVRVIAKVATSIPNASASPFSACNPGSISLTASGAGSGQDYKWYDALVGGVLLGTGSPFTYNLTASATIYVAVTEGTCESSVRQPVVLTLVGSPSAPGTTNADKCGPGSVSLPATSSTSGAVYQWFDAATNGNLVFTGNPYLPALTATDTFYVQVQGVGSCNSPRTMAIATIKPVPVIPTGSDVTRCGDGSVDLTSVLTGVGILNWFTQAIGGISIATGPAFTTPALTSTTSYFVSGILDGCEGPRFEIKGIVNPVPASPTGADISNCGTGSVILNASQSAALPINWFADAIGGVSLFTGNAFTTPSVSVTTSYFISSSLGNCESPRIEIKAIINPAISSPTGQDVARCGAGAVDLVVVPSSGSVAQWYTTQTGGTPVFTGSIFSTAVLNSTTSYFVSSAAAGCESNRIEIKAIINQQPATPSGTDISRCGVGSASIAVTGPGEFSWYDAPVDGNLLFTGNPYQTPGLSTNTSYYVSASLDGCVSQRKEIIVSIFTLPPAPVGDTVQRCGPGSVTLTASSTAVSNFRWYTALNGGSLLSSSASLTTDVQSTKLFFVASVNSQGCESSRVISQAIVNAIPQPNASANPEIIKPGESSVLSATGGGTYNWTPSLSLSSHIVASPIATPGSTTTYKVVVNFRGCVGVDSVTVQVDGVGTEIPNVFTPNNDGIFDTWIIPEALANSSNKLIVFNRWGSIVKETSGYKNDWDGGDLPSGTYYYSYEDGKTTKSGTVTIIR